MPPVGVAATTSSSGYEILGAVYFFRAVRLGFKVVSIALALSSDPLGSTSIKVVFLVPDGPASTGDTTRKSVSPSLLLSMSMGVAESTFCRFRGVPAVSLTEEGFRGVPETADGVDSVGVFLKKFEIDGLKPLIESTPFNQSEQP